MAASRLISTRDADGKPVFVDPEAISLVTTAYSDTRGCDIARVILSPMSWFEMTYEDFLRDIGPYTRTSRK